MTDIQISEMREALLAVLSKAASMGIDVDLLGRLAADELLDEQSSDGAKPYAAGAVYQLATCIERVLEPDD
ncbi:hypothetical protein [Pseudomonas cichorii]|uniref:Uncharacterized protein n=1 Tax=Pseudomonas cichorii TaxID=36746 RepID=A0A3M4WGH8_PSECI|nr:hypothetical protein [Pseudomonas cichorii]AHF66539.1 hypothetical protein PCH70_13860 [Pseudomonas cichorii JBC1]QVE18466.1 hypothetical protein KGD89_06895 [Pseudomonas cichorii]RMR63146.1 hypothetical protein ALP84_01879 [Pseudomonas cichorii]SDO33098.1 hypothetical protein SAMN05216599_1083 [Pseudomonas cichorii]GFM95023.1 hypothetical protein PSCICP_49950 [Pseudomonas cichorii]